MDKDAVITALRAQVRGDRDALEGILQMSVDEATGAESKPENKYDTRSTESSYLAAGQGQRVLELRRLAAVLDSVNVPPSETIALWSLVELDGDAWFLVTPDGGGRKVEVGGTTIAVVTPQSPVGVALVGARVGDVVRAGPREVEVIGVS
jgi:hypothetical protein